MHIFSNRHNIQKIYSLSGNRLLFFHLITRKGVYQIPVYGSTFRISPGHASLRKS